MIPLRRQFRRALRGLADPTQIFRRLKVRRLARADVAALEANLADPPVHPDSFLFITLDSCRSDIFQEADCPNLKGIGEWFEAQAPATFTFASHAAMWVGMTPGQATSREPWRNPKAGRIFRLVNAVAGGLRADYLQLSGRTIIEGFNNLGYHTIGTAGVRWFDPRVTTGQFLTRDFAEYLYAGTDVQAQVAYVMEAMARQRERPVFAFINVGETHVPYFHKDAPWSRHDNPCVPFAEDNDAEACRVRQRACLEFVDRCLKPLLDVFTRAGCSIYCCSDHGDCHGEDGLWAHGFYHDKVIKVPVVFRFRSRPAATEDTVREVAAAVAAEEVLDD